MTAQLLFLCARGSSRSVLAASLLQAQVRNPFDVWSSIPDDDHGRLLVERVLYEQDIPLLSSEHIISPMIGTRWEEGIVLCSGVGDT